MASRLANGFPFAVVSRGRSLGGLLLFLLGFLLGFLLEFLFLLLGFAFSFFIVVVFST
jgi:hypothetical protein